ncbi:hypothetical protein ACFU8I_32095 [Streptomyces sp. NPDC057540]|uniref:hypothetical protein n=1 Tax=Streptomyces sp. NPDC057540 TaxID=3346160 RepID=UPI0036B3E46E
MGDILWRIASAVGATWGVLIVLLLAPSLLPEQWHHSIYSPASVGLWFLAMFIAPLVACAVKWEWIKKGSTRA